MSDQKTISEKIFERFLREKQLTFSRIKTADSPRPDYMVQVNDKKIVFEVKELAEDDNFQTENIPISSRTVGDHVRKKIQKSRKQIQVYAKEGTPSILLIYNNIDSMHLFGTENVDFICAMYGEYTVSLDKNSGKVVDHFHGRNQLLASAKNTSFSAIGRLYPSSGKLKITLFDNVFAKNRIQYSDLPSCFDIIKFEIE